MDSKIWVRHMVDEVKGNQMEETERKSHWLSVILVALITLFSPFVTQAAYKDVIEMEAVKVDSARSSLALDVARAGDRLVVVGERGHVLYSDDNGESWTQADVATRSQLNAVAFINSKLGWAVGEDAVIVHTTDGGNSWTRQFDDRDADVRGPLLDVVFLSENEGFVVGVFNKMFKTTDGGVTWNDWSEHVDNLDGWHLFNIATSADGVLYIGSEQGLVFKSTDRGESFVPIQTDHVGSFPGVIARRGEDGSDRVIAFGPGGAIWVSSDSAETWTKLETQTLAGLLGGAWLPDGSAVIVGHEGMLLRIDRMLEEVDYQPNESGMPLSAVLPASENRLILVGFGGPQVVAIPPAVQ
jgi:photosystem II stability/assembly factor-like uncharacterized protein